MTKKFYLKYFLVLIFIVGCENNITTPISYQNLGKPNPIIESISPTEGLAGVSKITISGSNFSTVKTENLVYFDKTLVAVDSSTTTKIFLTAPVISKDTITVKLTVIGAGEFSNSKIIRLESAIKEYGDFTAIDEPWGITSDPNGNLYVSLMTSGSGVGIKKISTSGVKTDYATTPGITKFSNLIYASDGTIYGARGVKAIYKIPPGGGTSSIWVSFGLLGSIFDFDFDQNGNIWAGGSGNAFINSIKLDKTIKQFTIDGNARTIKVNNNYVYIAGQFQNEEKILRAKIISTDSISSWEEYFNLTTSTLGGSNIFIYGLGFLDNGELYFGTDHSTPIKVIKTDKTVVDLYAGVLSPIMHILTKGPSGYIYSVQGLGSSGNITKSNKIYKIVALK